MKIDELIVTLMLDAKGFTKGQKDTQEALDKTSKLSEQRRKEMELDAKRMTEAFGKFKNEILGLSAALLGATGLKNFIENVTQTDAAVMRLAKNLGIPTETVSAWEGAAKDMGSSAADMDDSFRKVVKMGEDFKNAGWSEAMNPLLRAFGMAHVAVDQFEKLSTSAPERLKILSDVFSKLSPPDAQYWGQMAGFTESQINMLRAGRSALEAELALQYKLGTVNDKLGKESQDRINKWNHLSTQFTRIADRFLNSVSPPVQKYLGKVTEQFEQPASQALNPFKLQPMDKAVLNREWGMDKAFFEWLLGKNTSQTRSPTYLGAINRTPSTVKRVTLPELLFAPLLPHGIRTNNPGNLKYAGQAGAIPEPGTPFAEFHSLVQGLTALAKQLQRYADRHMDTVRVIISKYAPTSENNTEAYIKAIAKTLGVNENAHLDLGNLDVLRKLILGISAYENRGPFIDSAQINAALSQMHTNLALAHHPLPAGPVHHNNKTSETHIHNLNIYTQATDAKGIAKDAAQQLVSQINTGLE